MYKKVLLTLALCVSSDLLSVTKQGRISQLIEPTLSLQRVSDLSFPVAFPGAREVTVRPEKSENRNNASFFVVGTPFKRVRVLLPSGVIKLHSNVSRYKIRVKKLRYRTSSNSILNRDGEMSIFVGGTREAISSRTPPGLYSGSFVMTVIY